MTPMRTDIQALRGVAVLMVILYHVKIGSVEAGHLGVDVFFIISGYLITTLVASGIERHDFRLSEFYFRRAKRLLPAAYVTVLMTALFAPWFLNQQELQDFALQVVGAITFTANIVLWKQTGYFEGASDLKPLLHMWSLSLEEQYYMLLPAALLLCRRTLWLSAAVALFVISLGLCVLGMAFKPIATFYLLPTRAWELLIGSMGALLVAKPGAMDRIAGSVFVRVLFYPSILCLLLLAMFPVRGSHPGVAAFVICLATLFIILRRHMGLERAAITKVLARVGDISYSLYLVHWPIIALTKNAWAGTDPELPGHFRLGALVLSFATAYLLYRFVEDPIRRARFRFSPRLLLKTSLASALLMVLAPAAIYARSGTESVDYRVLRRVNFGFGEACEYGAVFSPKAACTSSDSPKVMVWGDSYAMHLVPGLLEQHETGGVVQATRSVCGPFLDLGPQRLINPETGPVYDRAWAERCIEFNRSVLEFIRQSKSIETVVLSSLLSQYVDELNWVHVMRSGEDFNVVKPSIKNSVEVLERTAHELRAAGKKVVLFAPPPSVGMDLSACQERRLSGRIALGAPAGCVISVDVYQGKRVSELALLDSLEKAAFPVIRLDPFLCNAESCQTLIDGTLVYRDMGHLSYEGSRLLAIRMNWAALIEQQAR